MVMPDPAISLVLFAIALVGVAAGVANLTLIVAGRLHTRPGYGWETEAVHLVMNGAMALMLTSLWSRDTSLIGAASLAVGSLLLLLLLRDRAILGPETGRILAAAVVIHLTSAWLMVWLLVQMAPGMHVGMSMGHMGAGGDWPYWCAAAFYLFDTMTVVATPLLRDRLPSTVATLVVPLPAQLPHLAMNVGMIGMLTLL